MPMQKHIVTHTGSDTDGLFRLDPAAMAPRFGDLARHQLRAGLSPRNAARLAAHNAFLAVPALRDDEVTH